MADVFISYAHQDENRAIRIASLLEQHGLSIWWDRHIPPGKTWDQVIGTALDEAECVVVLWSRNSVKSDWVKDEASRGARREALVPVIFDHVDSPLGFGRIEAAQFSDCEEDNSHPEVQAFVAAVKARVMAGQEREPSDSSRVDDLGLKTDSATSSQTQRWKIAVSTGVVLLVVLAAGFWWFSQDAAQELEVQIWDVEGDRKRSMVTSRGFTQKNHNALEAALIQDVRTWVLGAVSQGEEAAKPRVEVNLSIPADLKTGSIRLSADSDIDLQTHLYVVKGTGKARVVSDLNHEALGLLEDDFVIEIGAIGYSSVPVEVEWGKAVQKTVDLRATRVNLAVENFSGHDNTVGPRLAHMLAQDPRISILGPDALDRLREEIAEIRKNVGFNPAIQMPLRDSLGVDFIVSGVYQRR